MNIRRLQWYWHRLRAMGPGEVLRHAARHWRGLMDRGRRWDWERCGLGAGGTYPALPARNLVPARLREAMERDAQAIREGRWRAFGHLELRVDVPPRWHCDYLAGEDRFTREPAVRLDHRDLPGGADIKLIWELSRWTQLTRLAMASYVFEDRAMAELCARWLWDWVERNPPYRGWNWTSALEAGLRLIQLAWMDALLVGRFEPGVGEEAWGALLRRLLPVHVRHVWRHRSFGSSANNHLLGELAGLIVATVRWPRLAQWGVSLMRLKAEFEREVLAQFAKDGGNREQGLNYHLFAFELCWQARLALAAAGRKLVPGVEDRLARAAGFYGGVQVAGELWDYGDSDNAYVVPGFESEQRAAQEWRGWILGTAEGAALEYWFGGSPGSRGLGDGKAACALAVGDWRMYPETGIGICEVGDWFLRWDLSPLGYMRTAAHGHGDALHLSVWRRGVALVIDPGTGAYYGDRELRAHLASRAAHNGPCPEVEAGPRRLGPFLWAGHHPQPRWGVRDEGGVKSVRGELQVEGGVLARTVCRLRDGDGWEVTDEYRRGVAGGRFAVLWQFAPGATVRRLEGRKYRVQRGEAGIEVEAGEGWSRVEEVEGRVSPAFRRVTMGPGLRLVAPDKPCVLSTRFLACGGV